jgi:hypothetical protein
LDPGSFRKTSAERSLGMAVGAHEVALVNFRSHRRNDRSEFGGGRV